MLTEGPGYYEYVSYPLAQIRTDSVCAGSGPGPAQPCDRFTALRRTVAGPGGIGDPVLIQRSYKSSGCPPTLEEMYPADTLREHPVFANLSAWNKGWDMTAYSTRNFSSNTSDVTERDVSSYYLSRPTNWSDGYDGILGWDNISTRLVSGCNTAAKYSSTTNDKLSRGSYGSYGMRS